MAFPVGTPVVTFTGTLPSAVAGTPFKGKVVLKPSARLIDAGRNAVYTGGGSVVLDDAAHFSVQILPCDAAGIEPAGWRWWVDVQPTRGQRYGFWANITGTGTVDLADLTPVPAPGGGPGGGGGGGAVSSVNGMVGAVVLDAGDVDADPEGTAAAAVAAHAVATDPHGDRAAAAAALASHEADTTSVHGIANTALLETQTGAQAKADAAQSAATAAAASDATSKVATHETDTTAVHGIANTALLETAAGAQNKADTAQAAAISTAASDATSKVSTHTAASDPHGDRADAATKYLAKTANLSDIANAATARTSLGLGGAAVLSVGSTAGTVAAGDDSRFSAIGGTGPQGPPGASGTVIRESTARITDGAIVDLASAAGWVIATTSVGTALQCSIPAAVGDRILVDMSMMYVGGHYLDLAILTSAGAISQYAASGTSSPLSEGSPDLYPSVSFSKTASATTFTVSAGQVDGSGNITIALAHQGTSSGKVYAHTTYPWKMRLQNIGPVGGSAAGSWLPRPSEQGLITWTGDPNDAGHVTAQSSAGVAGRITLVKIPIREQITWSNIWIGLSGIDAAATLSNCYLGVYDSSGTLKGVTADISSSLMTGATAKALPLAAPFTAAPGQYYIAMLLGNGSTWATNSLTFKATGAGISVNAGLSAGALRFSNMLTAQTSLPSSLTLSGQLTTIINTGWASQWYGVS